MKNWNLSNPKVRELFVASSTCVAQKDIVYPVPKEKIKANSINLADTKLVRCSNPKCFKMNEFGQQQPTYFHFCCYATNLEKDQTMNELVYNADIDTLSPEHEVELEKIALDKLKSTRVILPVCGKLCYNMIVKGRKKKIDSQNTKNMNDSTEIVPAEIPNQHKRWDSDGTENSLSSEAVIINWLTTAENAEQYFGGTHGKNNTVNGISKDTYHVRISNLIHKENCTYIE